MKNSQLAEKIYEILERRVQEDFPRRRGHHLWHDLLKRNGIARRHFWRDHEMIDELVDLANDGTADQVVCFDPFGEAGHQFLLVPQELAKKIVLLDGLPS